MENLHSKHFFLRNIFFAESRQNLLISMEKKVTKGKETKHEFYRETRCRQIFLQARFKSDCLRLFIQN